MRAALGEMEFAEAEEAAGAFPSVDARFVPLSRASAPWRVTRLDLGGCALTMFRVPGPLVSLGTTRSNVTQFTLVLDGGGSIVMNGESLDRNCIGCRGEALDYAAFLPQRTAGMILEVSSQELRSRHGLLALPARGQVVLRPTPRGLRGLRDTLARLLRAASRRPQSLASPRGRRLVRRQLLESLQRAFDTAEHRTALPETPQVGALRELLELRRDEAVYAWEICAALGIGDRALRRFFLQYLGVSPARYLRVRRLSMARRALLHPASSRVTVTDVGTGLGFFDLGRFASQYRGLFGENPSQTLRRARDSVFT